MKFFWKFVVPLALAGTIALSAALVNAGTWLVVQETLQPARAAVVLGGSAELRSREAAAVYHRGLVPEIWITTSGPLDKPHRHEGGTYDHNESSISRRILESLGVPSFAIRVLPEVSLNTAAEIRSIAHAFEFSGGDHLILITTKYHSRRVRVLWDALSRRPGAAIVRSTPDDPAEPERWWQHSGERWAVAREWLGLASAWVHSVTPE